MFENIIHHVLEPTEEVTVYASNLPEEICSVYKLGTAPLEFERSDVGFYRYVEEDGVRGFLLILDKNKTIAGAHNSDFIKEFENDPNHSFVRILEWDEKYFNPRIDIYKTG